MYCPLKEVFFYVGQSKDPVVRLEQHLREAKATSMHKKFPHLYDPPFRSGRQEHSGQRVDWIAWLLQQDQLPELVILEQIREPGRHWAREKVWITRLFDEGHPLTNQNGILDVHDDAILEEAVERGKRMFGGE